MKNFIIVKSLLVCVALALVGTTTYAVINEGSFSSVARTYESGAQEDDGAEKIKLAGYWDDIIEGSPMSGSFLSDAGIESVNASVAPINKSAITISGLQQLPTDDQPYTEGLIESHLTTDGETNHVADLSQVAELPQVDGAATTSEGIWLSNFQSEIDSSAAEVFYLFGNTPTGNSKASRAAGMPIHGSSGVTPLLDGLNLAQTLDWYDVGEPESAEQVLELGAVTDEERGAVSAWVDVSEFTIDIKDVPGPSPLALLSLGVFALLLKRGRTKV